MMNLALTGLERHITDTLPKSQGGMRTKIHVITFADDLDIIRNNHVMMENRYILNVSTQ
jgi:hypothetical protein